MSQIFFCARGSRSLCRAVRALNSFIHEVEDRIRRVLEPRDRQLGLLGIASSTGKLSFSPKLGGQQLEEVIAIGVKDGDRSGFYIRLDLNETPSRSLYVGFWLCMRAATAPGGIVRTAPPTLELGRSSD